jgi:predicted transcriptional regulator
MTPKEQVAQLTKQLREAAKMQEPLAIAAVKLIQYAGDEQKDKLVDVVGDDMLRVQGAAKKLAVMHRELTNDPPSIGPKE